MAAPGTSSITSPRSRRAARTSRPTCNGRRSRRRGRRIRSSGDEALMRTISAMKTLLIAAVATSSVLLSACARSPQRLDLVALNGQPVAQAVIDQRECEAEFPFTREESTLQAYAACLIARGYISEVP